MSQPSQKHGSSPVKSADLSWSHGEITAPHRAARNGHQSAIVWLTGLSASGKSTIARALELELFERGMQVFVLEGDNLRHGLNRNLGFSPEDRSENIRRAAEVARLLADAGLIVIAAFISPYRADRAAARDIARAAGHPFAEVFVNAPLEVCETRDPKQLYQKARTGLIKEFTGV
jgi:adenylyl-sulfate kinase